MAKDKSMTQPGRQSEDELAKRRRQATGPFQRVPSGETRPAPPRTTYTLPQRTAPKRQKKRWVPLLILSAVLFSLQGGVVFYLFKSRAAKNDEAAMGSKQLAERALAEVRANRFAVALALLEQAQARANDPVAAAELRQHEVEIRLAMARRLRNVGNDVAAKIELSRVLQLSPGHTEATDALAAIARVEKAAGSLQGKPIQPDSGASAAATGRVAATEAAPTRRPGRLEKARTKSRGKGSKTKLAAASVSAKHAAAAPTVSEEPPQPQPTVEPSPPPKPAQQPKPAAQPPKPAAQPPKKAPPKPAPPKPSAYVMKLPASLDVDSTGGLERALQNVEREAARALGRESLGNITSRLSAYVRDVLLAATGRTTIYPASFGNIIVTGFRAGKSSAQIAAELVSQQKARR